MALRFAQTEDIAEHLRALPRVVDRLETRAADGEARLLAWIRDVENTLERHRLADVSNLAACRVELLAAMRSNTAAREVSRGSSRRQRAETTARIVQRCNDVLQSLLAERRPVFSEAERLASQLITIAQAKGILDKPLPSEEHTRYLLRVASMIENDADLSAPLLHLRSLVGRYDALVFLDRAMSS